MKTLRKLAVIIFVSVVIAAAIGIGASTRTSTSVGKGFYFGPPEAQQKMEYGGVYGVSRRGFPATYREIQKFQATDGATFETSYDSKPFNLFLLVINVVLLLSLLVALLAPITIFWRPKKKLNEVKPTEKKPASQVKSDHADTGN